MEGRFTAVGRSAHGLGVKRPFTEPLCVLQQLSSAIATCMLLIVMLVVTNAAKQGGQAEYKHNEQHLHVSVTCSRCLSEP